MFDSRRAFYLKIFPPIAAHYEKMSSAAFRAEPKAMRRVATPANPEQSPARFSLSIEDILPRAGIMGHFVPPPPLYVL